MSECLFGTCFDLCMSYQITFMLFPRENEVVSVYLSGLLPHRAVLHTEISLLSFSGCGVVTRGPIGWVPAVLLAITVCTAG